MILTFDQMRHGSEWNQIFQNHVRERPGEWESDFPNEILGENGYAAAVAADPRIILIGASVDEIERFAEFGLNDAAMFNLFLSGMGRLGLMSFVTASRQLLGEMVQSIGILSNQFPMLAKVFKGPADKAFSITDIVGGFVNSELFAAALDVIGLIPVVGWIIKVVIEVVKLVANFVAMARNMGEKDARSIAAKELVLPISGTKFSTSGDQEMARNILRAFRHGEVSTQFLVQPPYVGKIQAQGVYDDGKPGMHDETMSLGWVIRPELGYGGGYVPGTGNMTGSLFITAGVQKQRNSDRRIPGGGALRDTGSLYPTATGLLNNWWSMVLERGPMMFTVNPHPLMHTWAEYIRKMLILGPDVLQGWAQAPTGIPFTNKFWCLRGMGPAIPNWEGAGKHDYLSPKRDKEGVGDCDYRKRGKQLTLPSEWGIDAHLMTLAHIYKLFFGLQKLSDREGSYRCHERDGRLECYGLPLEANPKFYETPHQGKWAEPDSVDVDQSVPVRALQNLHERQVNVLQSLDAFYVNGENPDQFAAFKDNQPLVNQWTESITAIVNSDDWRRISFANVPEGRAKEHLRRRVEQAGINPETLNPPCPPGAPPSHPCRQMPLAVGPSVLGDPALPKPPPTNDAEMVEFVPIIEPVKVYPVKPKRRPKAAGGAGALIAVAAVAAFLAARK